MRFYPAQTTTETAEQKRERLERASKVAMTLFIEEMRSSSKPKLVPLKKWNICYSAENKQKLHVRLVW